MLVNPFLFYWRIKMNKVYNKRHGDAPLGAVYIGRGSKWGNPFTHLKSKTLASYVVETRDQAVDKYREYLYNNAELMDSLDELRGKDLVCYCAPQRCHGDILLEVANDESSPAMWS
jgi:hypothetical protein